MKVLVIIPAFNEEESIEKTVNELRETAPGYDYIVVNDCSDDETKNILRNKGINYLDLAVNLGIGGGVQTGYKYAFENGYDIAVQMDGDGQHDPAYLSEIVEPVMSGEADLCIGSRFVEKKGFQSSFLRRFGIRFLSFIIRLVSGVRVTDATSGFRACNKELIKHYTKHYAQDYPEPEAIVSAALHGYKVKDKAVVMRDRQGGRSSISAFKSVYYMMKVSIAILLYRFMIRER
jgi:glycosyltransferase involved in cell wall biosynthesis